MKKPFHIQFFLCILFPVLSCMPAIGQGNSGIGCKTPLTYKIGEVDSRFDISESTLKQAIKEAAAAWSGVINREAAVFKPRGEITVNLIYDDRQHFGDQELSLRKKLSRKEIAINNLESRYEYSKSALESRIQSYLEKEQIFKLKLKRFNQWVESKNSKGGMNKNELPVYERKKAEIEELRKEMEQLQSGIKKEEKEVEDKRSELNKEIAERNILVNRYNRRYSGEKHFVQGVYKQKGNRKEINIYYFMNEKDLRLVLAHELGHALGLSHVKDRNAVMFDHSKNQLKTTLQLTEADRKAILKACGK